MLSRNITKSFKFSLRRIATTPQTQESFCSKLALLGGGQMSEAILNALKIKGAQSMKDVWVYDVSEERLSFLSKSFGISCADSAQDCINNADLVLLAVKPQNVNSLALSLTNPPTGLLLSIVAGLTIAEMREKFKTDKLIRSMPNTPAMVLEGITVWTPTNATPEDMLEKARRLLGSFGEQIEVSDENYLDMATAVSGSGPAYVFLTMEAMIDAAVHLGFPRNTAKKLVLATLRGSSSYAQLSNETIPTLKNNVTSPGGTTASALYELEKGGFRTVVADAIWAAYRRALELGGQNPNVGPGRNKKNN
eukprot:gene10256-13793_t